MRSRIQRKISVQIWRNPHIKAAFISFVRFKKVCSSSVSVSNACISPKRYETGTSRYSAIAVILSSDGIFPFRHFVRRLLDKCKSNNIFLADIFFSFNFISITCKYILISTPDITEIADVTKEDGNAVFTPIREDILNIIVKDISGYEFERIVDMLFDHGKADITSLKKFI